MNNSRALLTIALVIGIGWLLYLLAPILTPFLVSLLLAYIANPLVTRAEQVGVPRSATIVLLFVLFTLALLGLVLGVVPLIQEQVVGFSAKVPAYVDWMQAKLYLWSNGMLSFDVETLKGEAARRWQDVGKWMGTIVTFATDSGTRLIGWLLNLFLVPVVTFYLLRDWDEVIHGTAQLLPPPTRKRVAPFAREADDALAGFVRGQLSVMIALAIIYSVGLWLAGLDMALPIGIISGLVSFVPYLGFILGIVIASLAALFQFQDLLPLAWVLLAFVVGQVLESTVLTPRFVGERIGMHPVVVIFVVMAGGQLFGFFGILLALPVGAVAMVWLRHVQAGYRSTARASKTPPA